MLCRVFIIIISPIAIFKIRISRLFNDVVIGIILLFNYTGTVIPYLWKERRKEEKRRKT